MSVQGVTPILNVSNVEESFDWFEALGWKRGFAWNVAGMMPRPAGEPKHLPNGGGEPTFGSVCSGDIEIFLCRGAQGARGVILPKHPGDDETDGVWMSWWVESPVEVDQLHALAQQQAFHVTYPPTNEPWGVREFHLRHPDGHTFRVGAGISPHVESA